MASAHSSIASPCGLPVSACITAASSSIRLGDDAFHCVSSVLRSAKLRPRPPGRCVARAVDGCLDVGRAGDRVGGHDLAGTRVERVEGRGRARAGRFGDRHGPNLLPHGPTAAATPAPRRRFPKAPSRRKDHNRAHHHRPDLAGFLLAENRNQPMHVAGLQLFEKPADAGPHFARELYESALDTEEVAPLFRKRPDPLAEQPGPVGLDRRHRVRHRAPRPAQRPARAGPDPRAAGAGLPAARPDAGPRAPALGGPHHRGPGRRPGRDVHQAAPLPGRRHLGDEADAERAHLRPGPAQHGAPVRRQGEHPRARRSATRRFRGRTDRGADGGAAYRDGDHRRRRRSAGRADQDPDQGRAQRGLSVLVLRTEVDVQRQHHRVATVRGRRLAAGTDPRDLQGQPDHHERRRAGDVRRRGAQLPARGQPAAGATHWSRWCRSA